MPKNDLIEQNVDGLHVEEMLRELSRRRLHLIVLFNDFLNVQNMLSRLITDLGHHIELLRSKSPPSDHAERVNKTP